MKAASPVAVVDRAGQAIRANDWKTVYRLVDWSDDQKRMLDEGRFAVEQYAGTRRTDVSTLLLALALLVAGVELGVATRAH